MSEDQESDRFEEIAALLLERWPILFKPENPKVLAAGISSGLYKGLDGAIPREELGVFLDWWKRREAYLLAVYRKPVHWGLDEKPAYIVKPEKKQDAWRQLISRFGYTEETLPPPKVPQKKPAPTPANPADSAQKIRTKTGKAKVSCTVDVEDLPVAKEGSTAVLLEISTADGMKLKAMVKRKSYTKAYTTAKESPTGAFVVVQGNLGAIHDGELHMEGVGLVVAPKKPKAPVEEEASG